MYVALGVVHAELVRNRLPMQGLVCRKGSARALETHIDIVCEEGFSEENRGPQHVRDCIFL